MPAPLVSTAARAMLGSGPRTIVGSGARAAGARVAGRAAAGGGFWDRAGNAGFQIQSWAQLFSGYAPRITHKIVVRAQGAPKTPLDTVVHLALATCFGCIPRDPILPTDVAISVQTSHTQNAAVVTFIFSQSSVLELTRAAMQTLPARGGFIRVPGIPGLLIPEKWFKDRNAGRPPPMPNNPPNPGDIKKQKEDANQVEKFMREAGAAMGLDLMFRLGRQTIRGGKAPAGLRPADPNAPPQPFAGMEQTVILTRDPAVLVAIPPGQRNPQPPFATTANDLKTLFAAVLTDPGVRPPIPSSWDNAPPVIRADLEDRGGDEAAKIAAAAAKAAEAVRQADEKRNNPPKR